MKRIGIIGGMGPESTIMYYRDLIHTYHDIDDHNTPEIIIFSINLEDFIRMQESGNKKGQLEILSHALHILESSSVDLIIMAANTPHVFYPELSEMTEIPIISIVEESAKETYKVSRTKKAGLLGTILTMEASFYPDIYKKYGLEVFIPDAHDRSIINYIIYNELVKGIIHEHSKNSLQKIIDKMIENHSIDTLILGCTELPLILENSDLDIQIINTLKIHVKSIVNCITNNV